MAETLGERPLLWVERLALHPAVHLSKMGIQREGERAEGWWLW